MEHGNRPLGGWDSGRSEHRRRFRWTLFARGIVAGTLAWALVIVGVSALVSSQLQPSDEVTAATQPSPQNTRERIRQERSERFAELRQTPARIADPSTSTDVGEAPDQSASLDNKVEAQLAPSGTETGGLSAIKGPLAAATSDLVSSVQGDAGLGTPALSPRSRPSLTLAGPAFDVNRRGFAVPRGTPLMSIVIDLNEREAESFEVETLRTLGMPLTVKVPANDADARDVAERTRAMGHEVLAGLDLSSIMLSTEPVATAADARPPDVVKDTLHQLASLDMAIGAAGRLDRAAPHDPVAFHRMMSILAAHGFAFLDSGRGLGSLAETVPKMLGVAFATGNVRITASANPGQIIELLDRGALIATQRGSVIVVVPPTPQVLGTLLQWALTRDETPLRMAPLSAVIDKRLSG